MDQYPSRVLANALVNTAWRNGPVEDIHAGRSEACPLGQRSVTSREERTLMRFASERMAFGMAVCTQFSTERPERRWQDQVSPYAVATMMLVTPSGWTLTEDSRDIRLAAFAE